MEEARCWIICIQHNQHPDDLLQLLIAVTEAPCSIVGVTAEKNEICSHDRSELLFNLHSNAVTLKT